MPTGGGVLYARDVRAAAPSSVETSPRPSWRAGIESAWAYWLGLSCHLQDAILYLLSGAFAGGTLAVAISADYREWAAMAMGPYLAAGVISLFAWRHRRDEGRAGTLQRLRGGVIVALLFATVVIPLAFQLVWRADSRPGAHAQPEVAVIERAGDRAARLQDPYPSKPASPGISPSSDRRSVDANSFFPYLPGMVPFGMTNALDGPAEATDARVALAGVTILIAVLALLLAPGDKDGRWRTMQMLIVFPTGALPLVTGGDDLPVLALMLLGLVLAARRRPVLAGVALGLSGTLKFTAWGLLLLLALGVRDPSGRRAGGRYLATALGVAVPVVGLGVIAGPRAFVLNVIEFPLGLTKVRSPAASPLPGQELIALLPHIANELTVLLVLAGVAAVVWGLVSYTPRDPAAVARFTALAIVLATLIAPATRFGYFIYPLNLFVWTSVLTSAQKGVGLSPFSTSAPVEKVAITN
ncbi:MAG: glycosyltransferase 87 family protein [Acidimicrobiales bacterium]